MRIGIGYDIHKLVPGRPFILGGVEIPFEKGLLGHSDGDPLIHSIIDAILGALGKGNIGLLFPDTDERFKGIASRVLLERVVEMFQFKVINIDSVVICEKPKLNPYLRRMKKVIAGILNIPEDRVSIKPRTKEGCDSTGKGESVEVFTVCLIEEVV